MPNADGSCSSPLDLLIFGDLRDNSKELSKRRLISDRMALREQGQWGMVWGQIGQRRTADKDTRGQEKATAKRVSTLLEAKELSRAAAAVWGSAGGSCLNDVLAKLRSTQPEEPPDRPQPPPTPPMDEALKRRIVVQIADNFGKFPKKSGVGPGGSRYEHWAPLEDDAEAGMEVAKCLARLAGGQMPPELGEPYYRHGSPASKKQLEECES